MKKNKREEDKKRRREEERERDDMNKSIEYQLSVVVGDDTRESIACRVHLSRDGRYLRINTHAD